MLAFSPNSLVHDDLVKLSLYAATRVRDTTARDELKNRIRSSASKKEELVAFLNSDGKVVWDRFIELLTSEQAGRDYRVFTDTERSLLHDDINRLFNVNGDNPHKSGVGTRRTRLGMAIALMVIGFAIIAVTYFFIPMLAKSLFDTQTEALDGTRSEAIDEATELLKSQLVADLRASLDSVSLGFKESAGGVESLNNAATSLSGDAQLLAGSADKFAETADKLTGAVKDIEEIGNQAQKFLDAQVSPPTENADSTASENTGGNQGTSKIKEALEKLVLLAEDSRPKEDLIEQSEKLMRRTNDDERKYRAMVKAFSAMTESASLRPRYVHWENDGGSFTLKGKESSWVYFDATAQKAFNLPLKSCSQDIIASLATTALEESSTEPTVDVGTANALAQSIYRSLNEGGPTVLLNDPMLTALRNVAPIGELAAKVKSLTELSTRLCF